MNEWQKSFLSINGLPTDITRIIGRQVRCRFPSTHQIASDQLSHDVDYTIQGISFSVDRDCDTGHPKGMSLLVEPSGEPANISGRQSIARPFLYHDGTSWTFYDINEHFPTDGEGFYLVFRWEVRPMTEVTLL